MSLIITPDKATIVDTGVGELSHATRHTKAQYFTPEQLDTLFCIADTVIPPITSEAELADFKAYVEKHRAPKNEEEWEHILRYAREGASESEEFRERMVVALEKNLRVKQREELQGLLGMLRSVSDICIERAWP